MTSKLLERPELIQIDDPMEAEAEPSSSPQDIKEVNVHCDKKDRAIYMKYYLSAEERREIISNIGDAACMLYEYYLRTASIPGLVVTDETAAAYFGWSTKKVQRNRLALIQAGWYDLAKYSITKSRKGVSYYIGKQAVDKYRYG